MPDTHYFHIRNAKRYGQTWDHVFEVSTYQMSTDLIARLPDLHAMHSMHGRGHPGAYDYGAYHGMIDKAIGILKNGKATPLPPLRLPSSLTAQAAPRQVLQRRPSGPIWNIPRLLQGDPRPAYNFQSLRDGKRRIARLAVSCFQDGALNTDQMKIRGRAIGSLLSALKRADFELEARLLYIGRPTIQHEMADSQKHPCRLLQEGHGAWIPRVGTCVHVMVDMPVHLPGRTLDYNRIASIFADERAITNALWPWRAITFGTGYFSPIDESATAEYFSREGWIYINNTVNGFGADQLCGTGARGGTARDLDGALRNPWASDENAARWIAYQLTSMGVYGRE